MSGTFESQLDHFKQQVYTPATTTESALCVASGALMILPVFGKRSFWRWTAAITGGALIYKGLSQWPDTSNGSQPHRISSTVEPITVEPISETITGTQPHRFSSTVEHISETVTIDESASELFALWRDPEVLAQVMQPFGDVTIIGPGHLRWTLNTPFGRYDHEAILVQDRADEFIHWRTAPDSALQVDEFMSFLPALDGLATEATLAYTIDYSRVPAGQLLRGITSFLERAPRMVIRKILHNFKNLAETGDIATVERSDSAPAAIFDDQDTLL